ncbi:hypothetical protein GCM10025760_25490 [Microbacterium yannicii]|uniref:CHAT domain-containing protein n=1 Tax=Microbacterium yannicii TaxID=671622 RepID=A0ABP9MET1_9MICO|nr:hypothetical protein [Microbacterium yannicii]MCO5952929.1 hypothetical protein [Microbacterium yannicii]
MARSYTTDWVRLTPRWHGDVMEIGYADSRGNAAPAAGDSAADGWVEYTARSRGFRPLDIPLLATSVRWPERAHEHLRELLDAGSQPMRDASGRPRRLPIAVLVADTFGGPPPPETLFHALMRASRVRADRYVVVFEAAASAHAPFALPFTVAASGAAFAQVSELSNHILSGLSIEERNSAIRLRRVRAGSAHDEPPDIVIDELHNLAGILSDLPGTRLLIASDPERRAGELPSTWLPSGTSAVVLPVGPAATAHWSRELLLGLIHDLPLQEAALNAIDVTLGPAARPDVRIWSSASGLDALRMSTAYNQFMDQTRPMFRLNGISGAVSHAVGRAPRTPAEHIDEAIRLATEASVDFRRESTGLWQLARARVARERAEKAIIELQTRARSIATPSEDDTVEPRRVAMWFEHDPSGRDPHTRMRELDKNTTLAHDSSYVLNVGIGIHWPTDLVPEDAPAIDPLLPLQQQEEHQLRVAVFSDSSEIVGEASRELALPRHGPSEPVAFRIDTPAEGESTRLRVLIYFRSHLLQALTIDAALTAHERSRRRGVKTRVQFSRSTAFADLDTTPKRLLALATNEDLRAATHSFMFETGRGIHLTETLTSRARDAFTDFLGDVGSQLGGQGAMGSAEFDTAVRNLATTGHDLWLKLFTELGESTEGELERVRESAKGTVQLTRFEPAFCFPWSMLYDWDLPESSNALAAATVCRGIVDGALCTCGPDGPGLCVRGFWGIRFVIEEMIGEGSNERLTAARGGAEGHLVVCTNGTSDKWSDDIATTLSGAFGDLVDDFADDASLLDLLWDEQRRPAVLVAVGHVTTKPDERGEESSAPRMYVRASERYLTVDALVRARLQHKRGRWVQPRRPIVLLLGCETNRGDLAQAHNLVQGFTSVGAVSVIATEQVIDTRLARDVAVAVVGGLSATGPGEGLRSWRAQRMSEQNPLGLAFTCFGNADVVADQLAQPQSTAS